MLDVVSILSRMLTEPTDPFQSAKVEKVEKPDVPTPPIPPSATFEHPNTEAFPAYSARGKLLQLGQFNAATIRENQLESTGGKPEAAQQHAVVMRLADQYGAQLLAQLFPFFKDALRPDERERRRQEKQLDFSPDAEEQALEILDQVLQFAEDAENMDQFLLWLDERIQMMEWELVSRLGSLPEKAERMFRILRQASEALHYGVTPEHIRQTLVQEIQRKKDLQK